MQALQEQLSKITQVLQSLSKTDITTIDDAKSLKSLTFVVDKVLKSLAAEIGNLEQLKIKTLAKLAVKVDSMRPILEESEKKFMIKFICKPARELVPKHPMIQVNVGGGVTVPSYLYHDKMAVPIMSYGAIMLRNEPVIVYRFSKIDFVSCTGCQIMDFNGPTDNYRTICCGNSKTCEYNSNCKYYHDPLIWPDSDHTQRFIRTNLVKKNPYFGSTDLLSEQMGTLTFENLRTLARYCAVMSLLITVVARRV